MDFSFFPEDIGAEWLTAALQYWGSKWNSYANGYKRAADMLVQELSQKRPLKNDINILVYPILFLYRHHLELRLKQLTLETSRFLDAEREVPITHKIGQLWCDLRALLQEAHQAAGSGEDLEGFFAEIDECISFYTALDPTSMSFRYPVDTQNRPTLSIEYIRVGELANIVNRVSIALDGASTQVSVWAELKSDLNQEWLDDSYTDFPPY